jgi:hypothetical protein
LDDKRERDEFERIELHQKIDKARLFISQYESGLTTYRRNLEEHQYDLGRLDERLETGS